MGVHYLDSNFLSSCCISTLYHHRILCQKVWRSVKVHFFYCHDNNEYYVRMLFDPHVITPTFLIITTINFACNTSWVFIADRSYEKSWLVGLASFFLFLVAISNIVATGVLARNIAFYTDQLTTFKAIVYR